ncbi:GIY-YIG nuclease family protein [Burkholderia glumae]|uniref:GIY-YIG nuclease family protein n=2 Tax=Burkholderia glumae TaxID=337 RepID=A0ABY5BHG1_BURGL|nr:GIY-YIG nuclease family protein [Burkholderia glumae]ACR29852.1 excinuclease ABC subunit C [Burkholderia glumae BGR1]AJY67503.1 GIY-YIG catalytic domain protein [Burkholderia glumae LMG 2196 = ATCC 33617]MCM2482527.1 GIY-YIG nuclease family protein [Burkholderia glumae]MCM2507330.1 GIY-YIG nuclease family protein [Burkholderia glumae]MCM2539031.1 GIY-YIG nuclease family protein [Burkholderia glumae]
MSWFLYLIECADGSVYTGITTDVDARFARHANGTGARYTRSRKPRAVLAAFPLADRSVASRAEYWVKRLTPARKRELASGLRTLESVLPAGIVDGPPRDAAPDAPGIARGLRSRHAGGAPWAVEADDGAAPDPQPAWSLSAGRRRAGGPKPARPATGRSGRRVCAAA